jgi:hypothetical protein
VIGACACATRGRRVKIKKQMQRFMQDPLLQALRADPSSRPRVEKASRSRNEARIDLVLRHG